jgi:hypothetical protein
VLAIEGLDDALAQTIRLRIFDEHLCPRHSLQDAPLTTAEMENGTENKNDAENAHGQNVDVCDELSSLHYLKHSNEMDGFGSRCG